MTIQKLLELFWGLLPTKILRLESGSCINEIRAYIREVENNVWLYKDAGGYQLFNDLPPAPKGFQWKEHPNEY